MLYENFIELYIWDSYQHLGPISNFCDSNFP